MTKEPTKHRIDDQIDIDINHLKQWCGSSEAVTERLTPALIQRFGATLGEALQSATPVPPGIHWCLAHSPVETDSLAEDGHPQRGGFLPPVPLQRRMWAASEMLFKGRLEIDSDITRLSTVTDVDQKTSVRAGALVFVTVEHNYQQHGATVIEDRQTLVYRSAAPYEAASSEAGVARPQPDGERIGSLTPGNTLLFRYSALTFNSHRIHYDYNYATKQEQYPALVVQGPLMATVLMHAACRHSAGAQLERFSFRAVAPAFADEPLQIVRCDHSNWELHAPGARLVMTAEVEFET